MEDLNKLLQELQQQEDLIQFTEFTNDNAYEIGTWLVDIGRREGKNFTVDICRNGHQLYHYALPGTTPDNDEWIKRKNRVVNRFNHSSYFMGIYYKSRNTTIEEKHFLNPEEYAPHGGSFPIIIKNVGVIGTVTVSGLPQEEDHRLVVQVLMEFLGL